MTQEMEKNLFEVLKRIDEKLEFSSMATVRGPVADPSPGFSSISVGQWNGLGSFRGPIADPSPYQLLGRAQLARLKVHQIDGAIIELQNQISFLQTQKELLKEEHKL